jgi:hypothetical protein
MQDPREEVMTLERVLLQTIKFDLQVRHLSRVLCRAVDPGSLNPDPEKDLDQHFK